MIFRQRLLKNYPGKNVRVCVCLLFNILCVIIIGGDGNR